MAPWSMLHAQLHQTLKAQGSAIAPSRSLLPLQASLLVAVSGGQDSQCLLRLLIDLQRQWQWRIRVVHCNHQWRVDAAANADFVANWAAQLGLPCTVETAVSPPTSEAAARQWRYRVFTRVAQATGCTHVVTGHTASDRAETLLFNLLRGSGLDGLQALTWQRSLSPETPQISLVRPLLEITRAQTGAFCQEFQLPVWEDVTNQDRAYRRNRLRLDVLPLLQEHFNPQVEATLAQTAEILTAEVGFLSTAAAQIYSDCVEMAKLQRHSLQAAPLALQRRVIRQWLMDQLAIRPHFDHVEKVRTLIMAPNRSQTDPFPGGAIAVVEEPWIRIRHSSQAGSPTR